MGILCIAMLHPVVKATKGCEMADDSDAAFADFKLASEKGLTTEDSAASTTVL
jgi:hypothetical protein